MTRAEAREFIAAIVAMRSAVTDEQALAVPAVYPAWRADTDYAVGDRVRHNDVLYKVMTAHRSQADWMPDAAPSLFARVLIPDADVVPDWVQPDSTNPYSKGDKVRHNNLIWVSDMDGNVWEPGIYGWTNEE